MGKSKLEGIIMKKSFQKVVILAVGIVVMLIAGCDEEQNLSSTKSAVKKHQLIATENMRLKKELERRDTEIGRMQFINLCSLRSLQRQCKNIIHRKNCPIV